MSSVAFLFKISENVLESIKPFKTSHVLRKISFVRTLFMRVPDLHTAPKKPLIKIKTFLKKIDSYLENINSQDLLKRFDSTKFLEVLKSNKIA